VYAPQTYFVALILMLISMVCWGSWPNFLKKLPGWRLEYFYIDYTLGFLITAILFGVTPARGRSGFDVASGRAREADLRSSAGSSGTSAHPAAHGDRHRVGGGVPTRRFLPSCSSRASYWLQPVGTGGCWP
jgi:hypothetical protein